MATAMTRNALTLWMTARIKDLCAGDEDAWHELYYKINPRLRRHAAEMLRKNNSVDGHNLDDLVQETIWNVYTYCCQHPEMTELAWVFWVQQLEWLIGARLRRKQSTESQLGDDTGQIPDTRTADSSVRIEAAILREWVARKIEDPKVEFHSDPTKDRVTRDVLRLRRLNYKTLKATAEELDLTIDIVNRREQSGLEVLRKAIDDDDFE